MRRSCVFAAAWLLALPAMAHKPDQSNVPVCRCWNEGAEVSCQAGRAMAGTWGHVRIEVRAYDGTLVHTTKADASGKARFRRPEGEFYLLVGDKPGEAVEVDWRDVDAAPSRAALASTAP
ncbi:hypothetical protein [Pseudothauera rhizosphaerae]|uniref:Carboxypeptidase regulatory-like domain-containing protein n=1 Tax=Pseudothauera rhizosphaerae TaxID=2565932 RepID=A0A4S4ART0_9RHOO|nr:hypothetical protein [Pseudothauera rhizosphaerae]THF62531.1 hypothetical protein E6O51_06070 [Pseudothauera rhizosphaerae]